MLPPGVEYVGWNGNWTCSTPPGDRRDVTCVYDTDLHFWIPGSGSLGINATVSLGVVPGPTAIVGTIASAEVPLPPAPACGPSPSTTGCASAATAYAASQIRISSWGYTGGTVTNGPVALPAGFAFAGTVAGLPPWTCAAPASPTQVRCTTPYMVDQQSGFVSLRVNVAPDVAVPGPLFVHASIGNDVQPPPADCVAVPLQAGCARLQVPTRTPRVATIVGDGITHAPATFTLGREQGPIVVAYRNVGEANAGLTTIWTQLPSYFEFLGLLASSPAATCATQGTIAAGQVVRCTVAAVGTGAFGSGFLSLRVFAHRQAASPGPLPVVAAFDLANPSGAAILASCVANPAQAFCAHDAVPTLFLCAMQFEDGIFCDGFQPFVRPQAAAR